MNKLTIALCVIIAILLLFAATPGSILIIISFAAGVVLAPWINGSVNAGSQ